MLSRDLVPIARFRPRRAEPQNSSLLDRTREVGDRLFIDGRWRSLAQALGQEWKFSMIKGLPPSGPARTCAQDREGAWA
jgi:hypothetical protein